jgi:hypothetical protein
MVGVGGQFVIGDEVACDGFPIIGAEELRRCVPELACLAWGYGVETVLELDITTG